MPSWWGIKIFYSNQIDFLSLHIGDHGVVPARRVVPYLHRAAPCRRAGRVVPSPCLVSEVWPKARPEGTAGHQTKLVPDATAGQQDGWMGQ